MYCYSYVLNCEKILYNCASNSCKHSSQKWILAPRIQESVFICFPESFRHTQIGYSWVWISHCIPMNIPFNPNVSWLKQVRMSTTTTTTTTCPCCFWQSCKGPVILHHSQHQCAETADADHQQCRHRTTVSVTQKSSQPTAGATHWNNPGSSSVDRWKMGEGDQPPGRTYYDQMEYVVGLISLIYQVRSKCSWAGEYDHCCELWTYICQSFSCG